MEFWSHGKRGWAGGCLPLALNLNGLLSLWLGLVIPLPFEDCLIIDWEHKQLTDLYSSEQSLRKMLILQNSCSLWTQVAQLLCCTAALKVKLRPRGQWHWPGSRLLYTRASCSSHMLPVDIICGPPLSHIFIIPLSVPREMIRLLYTDHQGKFFLSGSHKSTLFYSW